VLPEGLVKPTKIGGIFVRTDDPAYLETQLDAPAQMFNLETLNVAELRAAYREKQRNFSTAPFDPDGRILRFFPGGFTIWSGYPGAGKSTLLRQLACHLMHRENTEFVCSLEEPPDLVFMRHAITALGTENPSDDGLQWCADIWVDRLKVWNYRPANGDARHLKIFAAIRVLARDYGMRHAVIDSLMCLDVSSDDWEAQRLFTQAMAETAQISGCHIHLVAHPRKPARGNAESDIGDVAGSADLGRKADNVLFVKRAMNEASIVTDGRTPMLVSIRKQRYGSGHIGDVQGWFSRQLRQFTIDQFQEQPTRYLPEMAYEHRIAAEPLE
jgi:twinkle protein